MKNLLQQIGRIFQRKENTTVPFKVLFADFKKSLELNNQVLDLIADANDKLSGDYIFDEQYIQNCCRYLTDLVRELIVIINHLTGQKYPGLFESFHSIEEELSQILKGGILFPVTDYVLPYGAIRRDVFDAVGGKNAHVAEIGSLLNLRIPAGFAITTAAFSAFWKHNDLEATVQTYTRQWDDGTLSVTEAARLIQEAIINSEVPKDVSLAILKAAALTTGRSKGEGQCFAVRSSALGEDDVASFAGQYLSRLNIPVQDLTTAYKEVLASLYNPGAMEYRKGKDFRSNEVIMSVACQLMIPATVSGVLYSYDPIRPEAETMLVNSAWGLGEPIVSGEVPTDHFVLDRQPPYTAREVNIVRKEQSMVLLGCSGTDMEPVLEEQRTMPSLQNEQLKELAEIGLQLERHFKKPQDVEFAVNAEGEIIILQSRQLTLQQERPPRACDLNGLDGQYKILMRGSGIAAMEGIASGPAWIYNETRNLDDFPMGAILVARYASPQLARVIHKAAGFITDIGSTTGHLATVAREFRVPALLNLEDATRRLEHGSDITLDTECLTIYEGIVQELHYFSLQEDPIEEMYEYRLLRRVLKKIEPLNLVDPTDEKFRPEFCKTYHDLTRFVHEKAVETIIHLNFYHAHHKDTQAGQLVWDYPLDLILIDVGGGIDGDHEKGIKPEQIVSVPMKALIRGMSHPGMWDMTPAGVDFSSFMSSLTRTAETGHSRPEDIGRNLAVISAEYTNINFRLGYHFTVIDAYVAESIADNHIYFRFSGGVTETTRRKRRTQLLYEILSHFDFLCEQHGDIIVARLKGMDQKSMLDRLFLLGMLVGFTRQLDVKMVSDDRIRFYFEQIKSIMEESHGK
jgi:pyruvate,water dikinase